MEGYELFPRNWESIAEYVGRGLSNTQCYNRYRNMLKPVIEKSKNNVEIQSDNESFEDSKKKRIYFTEEMVQ